MIDIRIKNHGDGQHAHILGLLPLWYDHGDPDRRSTIPVLWSQQYKAPQAVYLSQPCIDDLMRQNSCSKEEIMEAWAAGILAAKRRAKPIQRRQQKKQK
jgi:hypothetical protein